MKVHVKVCCISSVEEANLAIYAGANALGLVGHMPSGPGVIADEAIRMIATAVPPPISTFLLTSQTQAEGIIQHYLRCHTSAIQLVDAVAHREYPKIRLALPSVKLVQVIHVLDESSIDEALSYAAFADALLLDSGNPSLQVKVLGGTGSTHDWGISRRIIEKSPIPVFLAGGLNPSNIAEAIVATRPFGVDLCSGIRLGGKLDPDLMRLFFKQIPTANR